MDKALSLPCWCRWCNGRTGVHGPEAVKLSRQDAQAAIRAVPALPGDGWYAPTSYHRDSAHSHGPGGGGGEYAAEPVPEPRRCPLCQAPIMGWKTLPGGIGFRPCGHVFRQTAAGPEMSVSLAERTSYAAPEPVAMSPQQQLQAELDAQVCRSCGLAVPPADPATGLCRYCAQLDAYTRPELPAAEGYSQWRQAGIGLAIGVAIMILGVLCVLVASAPW